MQWIQRFYHNETQHYQKLSIQARRLLLSFFVFSLVNPLLGMVSTAFLFRESHTMTNVVIYNLMLFIGIPLGYYLNGTVLSKVNPTRLYFFGCMTQGFILLGLLLFPHLSLLLIELFGFGFGMMSGFFWANKSLLTLAITPSNQRMYFSSLEALVGTGTGIIMPFLVGWFLVFGRQIHLYSPQTAYMIVAVFQLSILAATGFLARGLPIQRTAIPKIHMFRVSRQWRKVRQYSFLLGLTNGTEIVLPTLMVLVLVGKENSLGTMQAGAGIFVAFSLYNIAKKISKEYRFIIFTVGVVCSLLASLLFGLNYSATGVVLYYVVNAFAGSFRWTLYGPMSFDVIDLEERRNSKHRYSYIFDQQLFLNLGRVTALACFLIIAQYSTNFALAWSPLIFALPQVLVLALMSRVEQQVLWDELYRKLLLFIYLRSAHTAASRQSLFNEVRDSE